jgi:hypothetical protein
MTTARFGDQALERAIDRSQLQRAMQEHERKAGDRLEEHLMGWDSPQPWIDLAMIHEGT